MLHVCNIMGTRYQTIIWSNIDTDQRGHGTSIVHDYLNKQHYDNNLLSYGQ